jgi:hypothetical protein
MFLSVVVMFKAKRASVTPFVPFIRTFSFTARVVCDDPPATTVAGGSSVAYRHQTRHPGAARAHTYAELIVCPLVVAGKMPLQASTTQELLATVFMFAKLANLALFWRGDRGASGTSISNPPLPLFFPLLFFLFFASVCVVCPY